MILSVLEHQKIHIGKNRDVENCRITEEDARVLRRFDKKQSIFRWQGDSVTAQQWVGVIALPGLSLELLPKISDSYSMDTMKELLLFLCKGAYQIPMRKNIRGRVDFAKNGLVEILIANYIELVERYVTQGFLQEYKRICQDLRQIKGSPDFAGGGSAAGRQPTRIWCRFSKMEIDCCFHRFLKGVLVHMGKGSRDHRNKNRLNSLLTYFQEIPDLKGKEGNLSHLIGGREGYFQGAFPGKASLVRELLQYGMLFEEGYSVSLSQGKYEVASVLFDMNRIFEGFLWQSYKGIYGQRVSYQRGDHYLLEEKEKGIKKIRLKPDLLIYPTDGAKSGEAIVVDTKWKVISSFVTREDVYQMNAYLSAIPKVTRAVLIYPRTRETQRIAGNYRFVDGEGNEKQLNVRTVDLSIAYDKKQFTAHLKGLLSEKEEGLGLTE